MTEQQTEACECWSANDEDFSCLGLDELLNENDELKPGDTVYRGEAVRPDPTSYVDANDVIEMLGERAYDDAGDHADGWPCVSKDAEGELNHLLAGWMQKHCPPPSFYRVKNSTPYVLTEADFEA